MRINGEEGKGYQNKILQLLKVPVGLSCSKQIHPLAPVQQSLSAQNPSPFSKKHKHMLNLKSMGFRHRLKVNYALACFVEEA